MRVSFTDDAGNEESLTSAPTAAVAAPLLPPDNVRAVTQNSGAVELTWDAPQDATVTGYRIERRRAGGGRSDQQRFAGRPRDNHTLVEDTGSADTGYTVTPWKKASSTSTGSAPATRPAQARRLAG